MKNKEIVTSAQIGALIKKRRKELGLSQEKLAESVGVTHQQVQRYENGLSMLNVENVQVIADILSIPVTVLFSPSVSAYSDETVQYPNPDEKTLLRYYRELEDGAEKRLAVKVIRQFGKKS